jgi:hypothetical protein
MVRNPRRGVHRRLEHDDAAGMTDNSPSARAWPTSLGPLILTAAFGLAGVLVGGLLVYYFGGSLEVEKQRMQVQLSAYADFAKAQASLQRAEQQEKDRSRKAAAVEDANVRIRDAAFRMIVFSPAEVVEAFAAFTRDRHPPECAAVTPQSDIDVYKRMRRQISGGSISDDDIVMVLFGCKRKAVATP